MPVQVVGDGGHGVPEGQGDKQDRERAMRLTEDVEPECVGADDVRDRQDAEKQGRYTRGSRGGGEIAKQRNDDEQDVE